MKTIPYVYIIKSKTLGVLYIGSKYAKGCNPEYFWKNYFTSSNLVKNIREVVGDDDFIYHILGTFDSSYKALEFERKLIDKILHREDYLNLHPNFLPESEEIFLNNLENQKKVASLMGKLSYINKTGIHKYTKEEKSEIASQGGHAAAEINKKLGRAIFDPDVRIKQHKTLKEKQISAYYDPELREEISSKGGKVGGFTKSYYEKNGLNEKDRIKAQSDRGKKGGPKNKGFVWITDGKENIKYTKNQQDIKSVEDFMKENTSFRKGRVLNKTYVTDGLYNKLIDIEKVDAFIKENSSFKKGRVLNKTWVNNGIENKQIDNDDISKFLNDNLDYTKGMKPKRRKIEN